jgi:hypothetical protein
MALITKLIDEGCLIFNITLGYPYYAPHLGRPFDRPTRNTSPPDEHPLVGVSRLLKAAGIFQAAFSDIPFVSTGYSWLRHFFPHVGAAIVGQGKASFVGLGRASFAYPDAPRDLMDRGTLDPQKTCITCSRCSELMREGYSTGCVIRDDIYGSLYKRLLAHKKTGESA